MFPKITYEELMQASEGFALSNLVRSGQFGHVYKGVLRDNMRIARQGLGFGICWRNFPEFQKGVSDSETNQAQKSDQDHYHMQQAGLQGSRFPFNVDGKPRAVPLPEAVAYLHHHSPVRVVHCDLKPSNILLDDVTKALVTDFGIAKLIKGGYETAAATSSLDSKSIRSTDGLLCGSVGYIAPEYGMGKRASNQGDVYSFRVLVQEIITGKRPTDPLFNNGSSLHEWFKSHYPHKLDTIIEQAVNSYCSGSPFSMPEYTSAEHVWRDVLVEIIELSLICMQFSPSVRPSMIDVAQEMWKLRQYLSNELVPSNK